MTQFLFLGSETELARVHDLLAVYAPEDASAGPQSAWLSAEGWPPNPGVSPSDLAPLREVEALLAAGRRNAAELDEPAALRRLAQAQRLAWEALSVPGAAAFCAEVELQLAVIAAQAGLWELAADSLARAARLDGARRLLAAEALPEVVALADRVFRDAAAGAEGELPIQTDAPEARIFVDDVDRGVAPQRVRLRAGTHALRIEAPGRLPYHARIEVAQGVRPEQRFVLAPDPRALATSRVRDALSADATTLAHATRALLSAAPELAGLSFLERDARTGRELAHACGANGCIEPLRIERGVARSHARGGRLTTETLAAARAWMHGHATSGEPRVTAAQPSWWNRWYVWTALAALAIGGSAVAAVTLAPPRERALRVIVDAGDLR